MRLFLALELPQSVRNELELQISSIKKDYASFTWVLPDDYHITLHFFGEVNNLESVKKKIEEAVYDIESFILYSLYSDLFLKDKILLYVGFRREKILEKLVEKIKNGFHSDESQKFVPHLTIARARTPSKQQYLLLKKKMHRLSIDIFFPVKKIHLFQNILEGQKPIYKKIATFPLLKQNRS